MMLQNENTVWDSYLFSFSHQKLNWIYFCCCTQESFCNMNKWLNEVEKYSSPKASIMVVGNKCDLEGKRIIDYKMGKVRSRIISHFWKFIIHSVRICAILAYLSFTQHIWTQQCLKFSFEAIAIKSAKIPKIPAHVCPKFSPPLPKSPSIAAWVPAHLHPPIFQASLFTSALGRDLTAEIFDHLRKGWVGIPGAV